MKHFSYSLYFPIFQGLHCTVLFDIGLVCQNIIGQNQDFPLPNKAKCSAYKNCMTLSLVCKAPAMTVRQNYCMQFGQREQATSRILKVVKFSPCNKYPN